MKYLITGANGTLGKLLVERLLQTVEPSEIALSVRDTTKANQWKERGVSVHQADFSDPASLEKAFAGVENVLIISPPVTGAVGMQMTGNAIDSAKKFGVRRLLYTSHMGASETSKFPPMINHAHAERKLIESGLKTLSLRDGFYANAATRYLASAMKAGELRLPKDGPVCWTTHEDLADYAIAALTEPSENGVTPPLTAGASLDFEQVLELVFKVTGKRIRRVVISDEEFVADLKKQKIPDAYLPVITGMFLASRNGEFAATNSALTQKLGRPPTSFENVIRSWAASLG